MKKVKQVVTATCKVTLWVFMGEGYLDLAMKMRESYYPERTINSEVCRRWDEFQTKVIPISSECQVVLKPCPFEDAESHSKRLISGIPSKGLPEINIE